MSQQHYSQEPKHGNGPDVHQQRKGETKERVFHTMEYYSAVKKNEGLTYVATLWVNREGSVFTGKSQP